MISIENNNNNSNTIESTMVVVTAAEKEMVSSTNQTIPPFKASFGNWVRIQSIFTGDNGINTTYYLTFNPSNSSCSVTNTSSQAVDTNDPTYSGNQMWQLTPDGHILSTTGSVVLDVSYSNVFTNSWNGDKTQLWTIDNYTNKIQNQGNGQYLDINMLNAITSPLNYNVTQLWYFGPTYPLNTILQQSAVPFPSFTGGELVAYQYISGSLVSGCNDIRTQYTNLPLISTFIPIMNELPCPSDCTQQEFDAVKTQLTSEFVRVSAIDSLFLYYGQFHTDLFTNSEAQLNAIIDTLQLETGKNSKIAAGSIGALFSGILYTALSFAPGVGPLIANIIQTGINIGVSYSNSNSHNAINPDPFSVEVSGLWGLLSSNFVSLLNITGQIQTQLLSDWGMMQAAYTCITQLTGPNSLAWTPNTKGQLLTLCQAGYTTAVVQCLMPIIYQVYVAKNSDISNVPKDVPPTCLYKTANHVFWIASNETCTIYPTDTFMKSYVWNNKVNQHHFYVSENGWNFPTSFAAAKSWRSGAPTFSNNTAVPMSLTITCGGDRPIGKTLATYSSFIYIYDDGQNPLPELKNAAYCTIDIREHVSGNYVASFSYYIYVPNPMTGVYIKCNTSKCYPGYKFGTTISIKVISQMVLLPL